MTEPHRTGGTTDPRQTVVFYDHEAASYERSRYQSAAGRRVDAFHKRVLQEQLFAGLPAQGRVLEIGCGTGRLLSHFRERGAEVVGIDASLGMLHAGRSARSSFGGAAQASAYQLPFAASSFDAAYAILVLNLLPDQARAFAEVARVLRPGGRFVFNLPNLASIYWPGGFYVNLRGRTVGRNAAGFRYSHWFTSGKVRHALTAAGLRVEHVLGQPPLLGAGVLTSPLPGQLPLSFLCKSLYFVARKDG